MSKYSGLWNLVKTMIPAAKMREAANGIVQQIIEQKKDYPLEENEETQIIFFFEQNGKSFFSIGFVNDQNQIVRQENTQPTDEMIEKFLENI